MSFSDIRAHTKIAKRLYENTFEIYAFTDSAIKRSKLRPQINQMACFLGIQPPIFDFSKFPQVVKFIADIALDITHMYVKQYDIDDNCVKYTLVNMYHSAHYLTITIQNEADISIQFGLPTTEYRYSA